MNKNEKFSSNNFIKKEEISKYKSKKFSKISKNLINHHNSIKVITKNNSKTNFNEFTNKGTDKCQKQINEVSKITKNLLSKHKNLNDIDTTKNFNLTNFSFFNNINKVTDKILKKSYSGKKEIYHQRLISDDFQKIKVINSNFNIKVNIKKNKVIKNIDIPNIKKMTNKYKISKNNNIKYEFKDENNNKENNINNTNTNFYSFQKNLNSQERISNLRISIPELSIKRVSIKNLEVKKFSKNNNNYIIKTSINLNKKKNILNYNNYQSEKNIFNKKINSNGGLNRFKTFIYIGADNKSKIKKENSKNVLITKEIKEKMKKIDLINDLQNKKNYNIILPNEKIDIIPININKKIIKNKSYNSCNNLNNNIKPQNSYKNSLFNINNNTSRNNTNVENTTYFTNFFTDKNKLNDEEINTISNKDNLENNPELNFFSIVNLIQKNKNSVY